MYDQPLSVIDKSLDTFNKLKWIRLFTDIERSKWKIILILIISILVSLIYMYGKQQQYTATALIHVAHNSSLSKSNVIELIKSNKVLNKVFLKTDLNIICEPIEIKYLGKIYHKFFSRHRLDTPKSGWIKLDKFISTFNWSDESIQIESFEIKNESLNKVHTLEVTSENDYILQIGEKSIKGFFDKLSVSTDGAIKAVVKKQNSNVGTKYSIKKQSLEVSVQRLRESLNIVTNEAIDFFHIEVQGYNKKKIIAELDRLLDIISTNPPYSESTKHLFDLISVVDTATLNVPSQKLLTNENFKIVGAGALIGLLFGIMLALLQAATYRRTRVSNPERLEEATGIPVYCTVPMISTQKIIGKNLGLLAFEDPSNSAIESLRSLRASLEFALLEAKNNIVMITGPSPGIGKSFISSNFAAVLSALPEKKVLLIDGDMRKGYLHSILNLSKSPGVHELITEKSTIEDTIHTIQSGDNTFDIITRGITPPNASELLTHSNFKNLLATLSGKYDLIIIDTPPIHAVVDPTVIGKYCGVVLMVIRSEFLSLKEISHAVTRLSHTGIETKGFIFNGYIVRNLFGLYGNRNSYGYKYSDYSDDS